MTSSAFYEFEYGFLKIGYTDTAIVELRQTERVSGPDEHSALSDWAFFQVRDYLDGHRRIFDFPMELRGTRFQKAVWEALRQIPYGETRTYKELAAAVGNPGASRAVGMANGNNPLMIAVLATGLLGRTGSSQATPGVSP